MQYPSDVISLVVFWRLKVHGQWRYFCRAVDRDGALVELS
jgi:hypothetical protein